MILCDGDCDENYGSCYWEEDYMTINCYGDNLCKKCMFKFTAEQEREEKHSG
tara:strand:+ start:3314 stop:3469 length:156 start_codon:yes stop_codon:yes gene_type:complete